jgi:hypothetical protein
MRGASAAMNTWELFCCGFGSVVPVIYRHIFDHFFPVFEEQNYVCLSCTTTLGLNISIS